MNNYTIAPLPNGADPRNIIAESIEASLQECALIWEAWGKGMPEVLSSVCLNTLETLDVVLDEEGEISKIIRGKIKDKRTKRIWKRTTYNIPKGASNITKRN